MSKIWVHEYLVPSLHFSIASFRVVVYAACMDYQKNVYTQETIDQINQVCYDQCAANWDRFPFPSDLPLLVHKYAKPELGQRVLDVGSGTGILARWLSSHDYNVLCIDPSPEMVKRCQEKGLTTSQTDIQHFQPEGQFALIFAILSLMHVTREDLPSQIKKLAEALVPGGIFFLAMLEGKGEGFYEGPYPRFFTYYTKEELLSLLSPYFVEKDYLYYKSSHVGYMLFVLERRVAGSP